MRLDSNADADTLAANRDLRKVLKQQSKNQLIDMVLELASVSATIHETNKFLNEQLKTLNEKVNNESAITEPSSTPA